MFHASTFNNAHTVAKINVDITTTEGDITSLLQNKKATKSKPISANNNKIKFINYSYLSLKI